MPLFDDVHKMRLADEAVPPLLTAIRDGQTAVVASLDALTVQVKRLADAVVLLDPPPEVIGIGVAENPPTPRP